MNDKLTIDLASVYGVDDRWMRRKNKGKDKNAGYRVYDVKGKEMKLIGKFREDEIKKDGISEEGFYGKMVVEEKDINKVLFVDTNIGLDHARAIGRDGYDVYYSVVHSDPYPKMQDEICGYGFPEIKKIWDWGEGLERGCKTVFFTDIGFGKTADFLRRKGYYVFGSDSVSERLETDRIWMRKVMDKLGISIPKGKMISGVDRLLRFVDNHNKKYFVKVNFVRGDFETMSTDNKEELMVALSKGAFAILGDEVKFVVEEPCDGVEIGVDFFFNGNEVSNVVFETIEVKGMGNVTKVVDVENSVWYDVLEKISGFLAKNGYHGMVGVEGFYDGDRIRVIDWSMRYPFICSHAYPEMIKDYGDIVVSVARGENVEIDVKSKYSSQIGVYTDNIDDWRIIRYRDGRWFIGFRKAILKDGNVWFVPGDYVVCVSVACDNSLSDVIRCAADGADSVEFRSSYHQGRELEEKIKVILEKAEGYGYDF